MMPYPPSNRTIDAEYYDGLTPVPVSGLLRMGPSMMSFEPRGGAATETVVVMYRDILDISELGGQTRVAFKGKDSSVANGLIAFADPEGRRNLRSLVSGSGTGTLSRLAAFMRHGPARRKLMLALPAVPVMALVIYGALFESYRLVPRSVDDRLGRLIAGRMTEEFKPPNRRRLGAVLERILKRLAQNESRHTYKILVLDHPMPNAFALPDGHIIILTGLVEASESPEEIAGVIAHEISHVEKRHGIRQLVRVLGMSYLLHMVVGAGFEELEMAETVSELSSLLVFLKYSREFEREADEDGLRLMQRARISSRGLIRFFKRLSGMPETAGAAGWLDTHPDMEDRIAYLAAESEKEKFRARPILRRGERWSRIKKS